MDEQQPNPSEESGNEQEEEHPRRSPNRLDRLMSSKERAEQEASEWSEIEQRGDPVPSSDREPPPLPDDTPIGLDTPAEGMPPVSPEPEKTGPKRPRRGRPRPDNPYPHPTDKPRPRPEPPSAPRSEPVSPPFGPLPAEVDQPDEGEEQGVLPLGGRPHERYQPPPDELRDVRIDSSGMPLPKHVPYEDLDATQVGQSAYRDDVVMPPAPPTQVHGEYPRLDPEIIQRPPTSRPRGRMSAEAPAPPPAPPTGRTYRQPSPESIRRPRPKRRRRRQPLSWGCATRTLVLTIIGGLVAAMIGTGGAAIYYAQVTAPSFRGIEEISDLQARALQFQTTRIRDREGNILYEINDPEGGFRDYVTLDEVSPIMLQATVATEERNFFTNPGFSIPAIVRAVIRNYQEGRSISGASTITQQLTRALLLPEEERSQRTYRRKIKEIFLAAELGRRFSKEEILELYLNQIYYGNLAYGVEAAAQTYFDKPASELNLAEASLLAGLPQAPAVWDPVLNHDDAITRQQQVLGLMLEAGCIDTGRSDLALPCVTDADISAARDDLAAVAAREFQAPTIQARYPHWVVYVQQQLEKDPAIGNAIYTSGFDVYTTLDPRLQDLAQQQVDTVIDSLADRNVTNASVIVIDVDTGAILAMVGSRDFDDESIDGQVNVALTPQQPGSSVKPFTYLAAFRQGWTPATVIWDVPIGYEIPGFGVYEPVNYDGRFHGPVSVRTALANSYNVPAVITLDHVGVPALLEVLNDVGITSLGDPSNPNQYGLSLTLGAGEVYLLEWANAFATLSRGGVLRPTYAIERIERNGEPIEGFPYQVPPGEQVVDPSDAYLLTTILSDTKARIPAFGENTPISPPYPAAAKTGTTNDFRDNWTMGYTSEIAVGVWVGNSDNSPMVNVSGVTGAGPIWRGIMDGATQWYPPQPFTRAPGVFEQTVCQDDGAEPSDYCLEHSGFYTELFSPNAPPPDASQGIYRRLNVDAFSGLIANEYCPDYAEESLFVVLPNPSQLIDLREFERNWLLNTDEGRQWATGRAIPLDALQVDPPEEACGPDTVAPTLFIDAPQANSDQQGEITIYGSADAPNFDHYLLDFGFGPDPGGWGVVKSATFEPVHNGMLAEFDLSDFENGPLTIRLLVFDTEGHSAEQRVTFNIDNPEPTATLTPTNRPTAAPTDTPRPSPSPEPTQEATPES
jgi:penicillin-binding protein 1C